MATATRIGDITNTLARPETKTEKKGHVDWLGQEYGPGDLVTWSTYGVSDIHIGEVVSITDSGNPVVVPVASAKHGKKSDYEIMIDRRTGDKVTTRWNKIDPVHQVRPRGYEFSDGSFLSFEDYYKIPYTQRDPSAKHVDPIWREHVIKLRVSGSPKTLRKQNNPTKFNGTLPKEFTTEWESNQV